MPNDDPWEPNSTGEILSAFRHGGRTVRDLTPEQRADWYEAVQGMHPGSTADTVFSVLQGRRPLSELSPDDRAVYESVTAQWAPTGQSGSGERAWLAMQAEREQAASVERPTVIANALAAKKRNRAPDLTDDRFRRHLDDAGRKVIEASEKLTKRAVVRYMPMQRTAFDEYVGPTRCNIDWDVWKADIERRYKRSKSG